MRPLVLFRVAKPEMSAMHILLGRGAGSHFAYYTDDGQLVIEWYNFGEDAPYESADMISFGEDSQSKIADRLGCAKGHIQLLKSLAASFTTYWAIKKWVRAERIAYVHSVDFMP
jgi:hypothetical protein